MHFESLYASFSTHVDIFRKQLDRALRESAKAMEYISVREEVEEILDKLEYKIRGKAVDNLSILLSYVLDDTLPSNNRRVRVSFSTFRGLPALNMHVLNGDYEESIMDGQGGAVANIISTALRLIALSRSGRRKFIILDEPDCWIKPELVKRFSDVIGRVAEKIGIQTLYISHHEPCYLADGNVVMMERKKGKVCTRYEDFERGPIEYVRLVNFMNHTDTFVPLSRGVTILTGENNIGKSSVAAAFKSVAYGEHSDAFVRHGTGGFKVEIGVEGKRVILCRNLRGKRKVTWKLEEGGKVVLETHQKPVPDKIVDVLRIMPIEGMDVQINNQKTPVFLIDKTPSERAKILNIGSESKHLYKLRENWKRTLDWAKHTQKKYREFIKNGNATLTKIKGWKIDEAYERLLSLKEEIEGMERKVDALRSLILSLDATASLIKALEPLRQFRSIAVPEITDISPLKDTIGEMVRTARVMSSLGRLKKTPVPSEPSLNDVSDLLSLGRRLSSIIGVVKALRQLGDYVKPTLPEIKSESVAESTIEAYNRVQKIKGSLSLKKEALAKAESEVKSAFVKLGYCPLCGRKVKSQGDISCHLEAV